MGDGSDVAQQVLRRAKKLRLVFRQGDPLVGDSAAHLAAQRQEPSLLLQLLWARGDQHALGKMGQTAWRPRRFSYFHPSSVDFQ